MHVSNTKDLILRYQNTPQQTIMQDFNIHYFQIYHSKKKKKKTMLLKQVRKKKKIFLLLFVILSHQQFANINSKQRK